MRFKLLISAAAGAWAYVGTTTFDTILLAHPEPTYCPRPTVGFPFTVDANYQVCCFDGMNPVTMTTATGPGGKKISACCESGYTCTGAAPVMSDWSMDSNGDVQYTPVTARAAPATTTQDASLSLDTVSSPGATPYTTVAGTVIYNNNINSNNNHDNNNNNGNNNTNSNNDHSGNTNSNNDNGGSSLSGGAIAGITVACTIISTIVGVLGLWYARKRRKERQDDDVYAPPALPQDLSPTPDLRSAPWPLSASSPMAQNYASSNLPQEIDWSPAHIRQAELDGSGQSGH